MAYRDDLRRLFGAPLENEGGGPPRAIPVGPAGPVQPTGGMAAGANGTGFVNASRLLGLNADSGARMGQAVADRVGSVAGAVKPMSTPAGPLRDTAVQQLSATRTQGGLQGLLRNVFGGTSPGGNRFDAALTSQTPGGAAALGGVRDAFSGLGLTPTNPVFGIPDIPGPSIDPTAGSLGVGHDRIGINRDLRRARVDARIRREPEMP